MICSPVISSTPVRFIGWASAFLLVASLSQGAEPAIVHVARDDGDLVELRNAPAALLARPATDWPRYFTVRVSGAATAMLGSYRSEKGTLIFEPRFPLRLGTRYVAQFDPSGDGTGHVIETMIFRPRPVQSSPTEVAQVYPTTDRLPENQLKFYLHFSRPMSRGEVYDRVRLIDQDGKTVERPFLELDEELWTLDFTRITLFLHPGRIKKGLIPREELGPPLEAGRQYTLVIDAKWPDADGNPLKSEFRKKFTAVDVDEKQPDPAMWKLAIPKAGSRDPLVVTFPESLDHALLKRMIRVHEVEGTASVGAKELSWSFVPKIPWQRGRNRILVDTVLEDLAGNSIAKPFEVDQLKPFERLRSKTIELAFEIK